MKTDDAKKLYQKYYNEQYKAFILGKGNEGDPLTLAKKGWGWIAASRDIDIFTKKVIPDTQGKLQVIKKNKQNHSLLWKTSSKKLSQGLRWGIIKAESITGQVIATLGQYRVAAHERIARGTVSNTQALKLALLDVYQDRMEALMHLESLVNRGASKQEYQAVISQYCSQLDKIKNSISKQFAPLHLKKLGFSHLIERLEEDIENDITNARDYLVTLDKKSLPAANRARGNQSILEFVKQTLHDQLYALQGLNQDVVYSIGTLTRGVMNDFIEDARFAIDAHKPDLRNTVTPKHHAQYAAPPESEVVYDFSRDHISPEEERKVLLAISFIEGWDKVDYLSDWSTPKVVNNKGKVANLEKISATQWAIHPQPLRFLWKNTKNWFKGLVVPTFPWGDKAFNNFSLFAHTLRTYARPNDPLWMKTWHFFKSIKNRLRDGIKGVYNFGRDFTISIPKALYNDWLASKSKPDLTDTLARADREVQLILDQEKKTLERVLKKVCQKPNEILGPQHRLATVDYHLTSGEEQDTVTALTQALGGFVGHFTHEIYTKDPVGSLLFTTAFAVGGACVLYPALCKTYFLEHYVNGFGSFAKMVGSSTVSKTLCAGLMQAQAAHLVWNAGLEGPSSDIVRLIQVFLDNPVPNAFGFAAAYGLGYALANLPIPQLHDFIKEELGSSEILNYPVIGLKFGVGLIMLVLSNKANGYLGIEIPYDGSELRKIRRSDLNSQQMYQMGLVCQQFNLVQWLNTHAEILPKLSNKTQSHLSRQIDTYFPSEQALSLKKMIYPEDSHSIAYQFFSVPLGYIPALLRVIFSFALSLGAWFNGNPNYTAPLKQATEALTRKVAKDCSRLVTATANLLFIATNIIATPFKVVGFTINLFLGRMAAFLEFHPGHAFHQFFAAIHRGYRTVSAFITPVRAMKSVVFADPIHTVNEVKESYKSFLKQLSTSEISKKHTYNIQEDKRLRRRPPLAVIKESVESDSQESSSKGEYTLVK